MKKVVAVMGVHAAGKTTLAEGLGAYGYSPLPEIGNALSSTVRCTTTSACSVFDNDIMLRELFRDTDILKSDSTPVIETWHPGNIAYAMARGNDEPVCSYLGALPTQLRKFDPTLLLLEIDEETFYQRSTLHADKELWDFFTKLYGHLKGVMDKFQLPYTTIDGNQPKEYVLSDALKVL